MTQHAKQAKTKPFNTTDWKIGIVVAEFNTDITEALLQSALRRADEYGLASEQITVIKVAGAVEIPLVLQKLAMSGTYDALLAIGCVIKGATPHFDYVCKFVTEGILRVQLDHTTPIGLGVLTCNIKSEAEERKHLGSDHLDAVLHQAKAIKSL